MSGNIPSYIPSTPPRGTICLRTSGALAERLVCKAHCPSNSPQAVDQGLSQCHPHHASPYRAFNSNKNRHNAVPSSSYRTDSPRTTHHLCSGWSRILHSESFTASYTALLGGCECSSPPLRLLTAFPRTSKQDDLLRHLRAWFLRLPSPDVVPRLVAVMTLSGTSEALCSAVCCIASQNV